MKQIHKLTRCKKYLSRLLFVSFASAITLMVTSAYGASSLEDERESGTIEFVARVTPTGARSEPVRQFTFYLLSKSYANIQAEAELAQPKPDQLSFIEKLTVSDDLKAWMRKNHTIDLTSPGIVKLLNADTILAIPEFRSAYVKANSGLTHGMPMPKFKDAGRTREPEKYAKQKADYETALHKFIEANPMTVEGTETELADVTPHLAWARLTNSYRQQMARRIPELAQTKYLVAKTETDLEGHAAFSGIAPGTYWISTLGLDAASGDARLNWNVEVEVRAGQPSRVELTNLNATEWQGSAMPGDKSGDSTK